VEVYQLIYTKVPPEESPWGKADFHTIFYPTDFMSKSDVIELEKRIHYPGQEDFNKKETVFFQKIQGKDHLIILHLRSLPEERDTFGRGGIFITHGFIFPPVLWRKVSSPAVLFRLVEDALFTSREEMLDSPLVDRETGNIKPLDVSEKKVDSLSTALAALSSELEWKMALFLNRLAVGSGEIPGILLKGKPEDVSGFMNRLVAFVPDDLKVFLGWDPAYEGGNLFFYPLKIVGFMHQRPSARNPVFVDLDTFTLEESPETAELFRLSAPYERWLNQCREEAVDKKRIEGAYRLSLALKEDAPLSGGVTLAERSCFASVNKEKIRDVFLHRCGRILGEVITNNVADMITPESMLDLIADDFPLLKLSAHVEDTILRKGLIPETAKTFLPDSLIGTGSYRLSLIERLWKGEKLVFADLVPLDTEQRREFVRYLLLSGWAEEGWVSDILKEDEEIFNHFLLSSETAKAINRILLGLISKESDYKGIFDLVLDEVLRQDKGYFLLSREVDFLEILEVYLKRGLRDVVEIERLISWAKKKKAPEGEFPYIRAFLYPKQGISEILLNDRMARERLIECLMQYHGYSTKELEGLGFERGELSKIEEHKGGGGWIKKVKGLLNFRK
jgi:hypothetical protein